MKRKNLIESFHKPNQLVQVSTNLVTITQYKAYNCILDKAKKDLRYNENLREFYFSFSELEEKSGLQGTNHKQMFEALEQLQHIFVKVIKDEKNWASFHLLSEVKRIDGKLRIALPPTICEELISGHYTTLDLLSLRGLKSKYSIKLYEMAEHYPVKTYFPTWTISEFKDLMGITGKKTYDDFYEVQRKILMPSVKELAEKEHIFLDYELEKDGSRYIKIRFFHTAVNKTSKEKIKDKKEKKLVAEVGKLFDDDAAMKDLWRD